MSIKLNNHYINELLEYEKVQNRFKNVEIGSYTFFRLGKIGVSLVIRSTEKKQIDDCYKEIISFLKNKKILIIER